MRKFRLKLSSSEVSDLRTFLELCLLVSNEEHEPGFKVALAVLAELYYRIMPKLAFVPIVIGKKEVRITLKYSEGIALNNVAFNLPESHYSTITVKTICLIQIGGYI